MPPLPSLSSQSLPRKVTGLLITGVGPPSAPRPPVAAGEPGSMAPLTLAEEFAALPGSAGFMLARLDAGAPAVIEARLPGQLFAVGSAFKLWVLDAVAADVAAGRLNGVRWSGWARARCPAA